MRSSETIGGNTTEYLEQVERDPSKPLFKFESKLAQKLREMKELGATRTQLKEEVRIRWLKFAPRLNIDPTTAYFASTYFFRLMYEEPLRATKQWELLYELAQNALDKERANEIVDELLNLNTEGVTLLWRLIKGIIKGDYYVGGTQHAGENIYYLFPPENRDELYKETQRHEVRDSVEGKFKGKVIVKPLPDNYEVATQMKAQDRSTFLKIYQYLQSDADTLLFSTSWQQYIENYFRGIENHFYSTLRCLPVEQTKSDARKERYRKFINLVVTKYLNRLRSFCLTMANSGKEKNAFVSDILFESHLIINNALSENQVEKTKNPEGPVLCTVEPTHTSIEKKWSLLYREIEQYVQDCATIMMMTALTPKVEERVKSGELTPEEFDQGISNGSGGFHPVNTGEVNPEYIKEVQRQAAKHLAIAAERRYKETPKAAEHEAETAQAVVPKERSPSKDALKRTVIFHGLPLGKDAPMGIPAIREIPQEHAGHRRRLDSASIEIPIPETNFDPSESIGTLLSRGDFRGVRSLIERSPQDILNHEDTLKAHLTSSFRRLPRSTNYNLAEPESRNDLLNETAELTDNYNLTPNLRRILMNELITYFELLAAENSFYKKELFDILMKLIERVRDGLVTPSVLQHPHKFLKTVKKKDQIKEELPTSATIDELTSKLPVIGKYPIFQADLSSEGLKTGVEEDEKRIQEQLIKMNLYFNGILKELRDKCSRGLSPVEAFIAVAQNFENEVLERLSKLKKFKVGFFRRNFGSSTLIQEKAEYYDESTECLERIWKEIYLPIIMAYGKVILLSPKETTA